MGVQFEGWSLKGKAERYDQYGKLDYCLLNDDKGQIYNTN